MMNTLTVQLLMTGNELMSGDVIDSNSAMMAQQLKESGISVSRKVTVKDDMQMLVDEITALSRTSDVLIINGGLGPTVDDMTAQALATVMEKPLAEHPEALAHLQRWCDQRGVALNQPNRKQALLPQGIDIINNPVGTAVGFTGHHNQCQIFCTPGVPSEATKMLSDEILPQLIQRLPQDQHTKVSRMQVFGIGESSVQRLIDEAFPEWPDDIELGFRAAMPLIEVKLTTSGQASHERSQKWQQRLRQLLSAHIIGDNQATLAGEVVGLLQSREQQLTLAESCTGGQIASMITSIAGASEVFEAGFVTYSNAIKTQLLGVRENSLEQDGAVSETVVRQMASGALHASGADYAIAVSGVAGPGGGSDEKPVGTVWLAWGDKQKLHAQSLYIPGSRRYFQHYVAAAALDLLRRHILDIDETPRYIKERQRPAN